MMRSIVFILFLGWVNFSLASSTEQPATEGSQVEGAASEPQTETVSDQTPHQVETSQGKKIYERFCIVCHRDGLVGAPKFRDEQAWKSHLAGKTIDQLIAVAIKGLNAMPAKGTCYECTDDDIKLAIEYMLPEK